MCKRGWTCWKNSAQNVIVKVAKHVLHCSWAVELSIVTVYCLCHIKLTFNTVVTAILVNVRSILISGCVDERAFTQDTLRIA